MSSSNVGKSCGQSPCVPEPTASSAEVREFLIQFILSQDPTNKLEEAQEKAHEISADGESFYGISKEEFRDELGPIGGVIHRALQTSKFGYVSELSQISTRRLY